MDETKALHLKDLSDEQFNDLLDRIMLKVLDATKNVDYYCNPHPSAADTLEFIERGMRDGSILHLSEETLAVAESLFRQGLVFRHSKRAIKEKATKYSRTEEKHMKELAENCQCPDCKDS